MLLAVVVVVVLLPAVDRDGRLYRCHVMDSIEAANGAVAEEGSVVMLQELFTVMTDAKVRQFARELRLLSGLHHPNLVPFLGM